MGELRTLDLGGRPVDTRATFPRGGEGAGVEGLRAYVQASRRGEFVDNLCRKLLAYGLGRTLIPSDDETIEAMRARLAAEWRPLQCLVETIVTSPPVSEQTDQIRQGGVIEMHERTGRNTTRVRRGARATRRDVPARRRRDDGLALAGIDPRLGKARPARARTCRRSGSPRCSWGAASTRKGGGPRARARRWSWAPVSSRWRR